VIFVIRAKPFTMIVYFESILFFSSTIDVFVNIVNN